ncbi:MAG: hypothetical protein IPM71_15450 [Bacteroidota bacterium]|nr:MAG: hypothetical protein IPM71_15450 [Bacteroidota bacterium]
MDKTIDIETKEIELENPILYKIELAKSEADNLLVLLEKEDINQAQLMPNLDKISETLIARWKHL